MPRWRNKKVTIWFTEEERELLRKRMTECGSKNMTDFIMKCICNHSSTVVDTKPLLAVKAELGKIGCNINQIAKVTNITQNINAGDVAKLQADVDRLRDIVNSAFCVCVREQ